MKFRFNLETVLKIRRHQEELEKQKLGLAIQQRNNILRSLQKVQGIMDALNKRFNSEKSVNANGLKRYYAALQDKQTTYMELKNKYAEAESEVLEQREVLLEANKKTKMLEKLKSRALSSYLRENDRVEQMELNEMATQKFNHSN